MFKDIQAIIDKISDNRRKYQTWQKVVSVLACITVFCTTYALILPAITLESSPDVICGMEEHTHTSDCYQRTPVLICENTDPDHEHTDECYQIDSVLICGKEEHKHSDACFPKAEEVESVEEQAVESAASVESVDPSDVSSEEAAKAVESQAEAKTEDEVASDEVASEEAKAEDEKAADKPEETVAEEEEETKTTKVLTRNFVSVAPLKATSDDPTIQRDGVVVNKTVNEVEGTNDQFILTLENYVQGSSDINWEEQPVPTDIILVLDKSKSMVDKSIKGKTTTTTEVNTPSRTNSAYFSASNSGKQLYGYDSSGKKVNVSLSRESITQNLYTYYKYTYTYQINGTSRTVESSGYRNSFLDKNTGESYTPQLEGITNYQLYYDTTITNTPTSTRLKALQNAVDTFVHNVAINASSKNVDHKISVVTFSTSAQDLTGGFVDMSQSGSETQVNNLIHGISAEGSTHTDLGMKKAESIMKNLYNGSDYDKENRQRVVVLFTDGVPGTVEGIWTQKDSYSGIDGYGDTSSEVIAINAVDASNRIKENYNTTVYSIGIFDNANASSLGTSDWSKKYNTAESHKPANNFMHKLSSNNGSLRKPSYYLTAADSDALNNIFVTIQQQISNVITVHLDENTIVRDIISPYFELRDGADVSQIKIYTAEYDGVDANGKDKFKAKKPISQDSGVTETVTPRIVNGNKIEVEGFIYKKYWCGMETENGSSTPHALGRKLIIEIPIVCNSDFIGGYNVPTNIQDKSGLFYPSENGETKVSDYPLPKVDYVLENEINQLVTKAENKTVYYKSQVNATELYFYKNTEGEFVPFITRLTDLANFIINGREPSGGLYYINDTEYKVDISNTAPGSDGATETKEYSAKLLFRKKGSNDAWQGFDLNPTVYVLVPQVAWQDTHSFFGQPYTNADCWTYNLDAANTKWVPDGNWTEGSNGVPQHEGSAPYELNRDTLSGTFEVSTDTTRPISLSDDYTLPPADVNVNVTAVSVGNENITGIVKFYWSCDVQHTNPAPNEFIIHVKSGVELPSTGGSGTKIWLIIGLTLMTVPVMIGLSIKRKHDLINVF